MPTDEKQADASVTEEHRKMALRVLFSGGEKLGAQLLANYSARVRLEETEAAERLIVQLLDGDIPAMSFNACDAIADALAKHDARVGAQARLAEAKEWAGGHKGQHEAQECRFCRRIAQLESAARESGGQT